LYAQMIYIRTLPSRFEQGMRILSESIVPARETQRGLMEFSLLVNRENHEMVVVIVWATLQDRLASERSGFIDQQLAKLTNVLREPPFGNSYDVERRS
jgi:heme-degrading monooxygenase HmoA